MPTITKLERQKKNTSRISVFVDGEFAFGVHEQVALKYFLKSGMELPADLRRKLEYDETISEARIVAERYLARSMRTEKEVRTRLREKDFRQEIIDIVVEALLRDHLLDDARYAEAFIRSAQRLKPRSRQKLLIDLRKKGVAEETARAALEEAEEPIDDSETAELIAAKYVATHKGVEPEKLKRRLFGYLQRRGFRAGDIFPAIRSVLEND